MLSKVEELDLLYNDAPVCPYCGEIDDCVEGERYFEQDAQILNECEYCGKEFYVYVNVRVTYSSEKYDHDEEVKRIIKRATHYVEHSQNLSKQVAFDWASSAQEVTHETIEAAKALYLI